MGCWWAALISGLVTSICPPSRYALGDALGRLLFSQKGCANLLLLFLAHWASRNPRLCCLPHLLANLSRYRFPGLGFRYSATMFIRAFPAAQR